MLALLWVGAHVYASTPAPSWANTSDTQLQPVVAAPDSVNASTGSSDLANATQAVHLFDAATMASIAEAETYKGKALTEQVCSGGLGRRRRALMDEAEQGWQTVEQLSCGRRAE